MKKPPRRRMALLVSCLFAATLLSANATAADSSGPRFSISRFAVEGNTLLTTAEVERLLAPFTGPSRDFADVRRARESLLAAYVARGYTVVDVQLPEQELNAGVVRLKVVEARIGKVNITGNQYFTADNIRRSLPALREGVTPNVNDISASLKLANESPVKQVTLKLATAVGGQDLIDANLTVAEDKPWRLGFTADNTGSKETGRTHLGLLWQHANLWDRDHLMSLQYTSTVEEPGKVAVYGMGYHVPFYGSGDSLDFYASHSDVDSGVISAGIFDLAVSGRGTVAGARYNHRLAKRGTLDQRVALGIDVKAYENDVLLGNIQLGNDITVRPLSLAWTMNSGEPGGREFNAGLTGIVNLSGGNNGSDVYFASARSGARARYRVLRYAAGWGTGFGAGWQMRLQFIGQYTSDALIPGEQFGLGGAASVRGFAEREVSGDKGHSANAELYTPNLCGALQCRAVAFLDGGAVSRNHALPGEEKKSSIAGAGVGMRLAMSRNITAQLDVGRVLNGGGSRQSGDSRVHFNVALFY